ncbi:flagellar hook-length control protein FliK [bacterium]|nr:flagellar hook-length control protein FliK [bacterium]
MLNLLPETLNNPAAAGVSRSCGIACQPESATAPEASGSAETHDFAEFLPEKSGEVKKNHHKSTEEPSQHSKTLDTGLGVRASHDTVHEKQTATKASGRSVPFHTTPNPALLKTKSGAPPALAGAGFLSSNRKASVGNPSSKASIRIKELTGVPQKTEVKQPSQTEELLSPKLGRTAEGGGRPLLSLGHASVVRTGAESSPQVLTADTDLNASSLETIQKVIDHKPDRIPVSELARHFKTVVVVKNSSGEAKSSNLGAPTSVGGNDSSLLKREESAQEAGTTEKPQVNTNAVKSGVRDGDKHDAANSDNKENNHTPESRSHAAEKSHTVIDGKQGDVLKAYKTPAQQSSSAARQGSRSQSSLPQPDRTELVSNIKLNLAAGRNELVLRLKPEVLGKALIIFNQGKDGLKLEFRIDHPDVRRVIEAEAVQLREALNAAGIQTSSIEVRVADEDNKRFTQTDENSEHKKQNKEQSRDEDNHQPGEHPLKPRYFGYNSFDIAA